MGKLTLPSHSRLTKLQMKLTETVVSSQVVTECVQFITRLLLDNCMVHKIVKGFLPNTLKFIAVCLHSSSHMAYVNGRNHVVF